MPQNTWQPRLTIFWSIQQNEKKKTLKNKDLAHLVDSQQEGIDQIETQMEGAKENTSTGLKHIEKANEHQQANCVVSWYI